MAGLESVIASRPFDSKAQGTGDGRTDDNPQDARKGLHTE